MNAKHLYLLIVLLELRTVLCSSLNIEKVAENSLDKICKQTDHTSRW